MKHFTTDILVVGAGLGGVSAARAALEDGRRVILTEPTRWIGGQLTSQLVPLDEHRHIEGTGANQSYRHLRNGIRDYYRDRFPLTDAARRDPHLNPGAAWVSPISHDPRVGLAVLESILMPFLADGRLTLLLETDPTAVHSDGDRVVAVDLHSRREGELQVTAAYVIDATELGDLLELGGVEHVMGRESQHDTGEPSAAATADPTDMQSATWCFAIEHLAGQDHTIDKPALYEHFVASRPGAWGGNPILGFNGPEEADGEQREYRLQINAGDDPARIDTDHRNMGSNPELWTYRRIAARDQFRPGTLASDITVVNWPMNDYVGGPLFGVPDAADHWDGARQLSLSLMYWLQTEAPRTDGGHGWPGLRIRADIAGTADGLAMMPYVREARRIVSRRRIVEQDISLAVRGDHGAVKFSDSVGVGHYFWMDRHATTGGRKGDAGRPHPFQIPLGALLPVRVRNLLPAGKNIGTTQITNGCYRLHPVEWSIGEAVGHLAAYCLATGQEPQQVHEDASQTVQFQDRLRKTGVQLDWPAGTPW